MENLGYMISLFVIVNYAAIVIVMGGGLMELLSYVNDIHYVSIQGNVSVLQGLRKNLGTHSC